MNDLTGKKLDGYIIVSVYEDMYYNGVVLGYKTEYKNNKIKESWATWYYVTHEGKLKFCNDGMTEKEANIDFLDRIRDLLM